MARRTRGDALSPGPSPTGVDAHPGHFGRAVVTVLGDDGPQGRPALGTPVTAVGLHVNAPTRVRMNVASS
jgi:hypothetical protein